MKKRLVFTVGNGMMGDDAAGPLLAEKMRQLPLEKWEALNGGSAPENCMHLVRKIAPEQVLIVDAADMNLTPGEIRLIDDGMIEDPFFLTTHSLPLSYMIQSMREFVPKVEFVGIQPEIVAFGFPVSGSVKEAVDQVYNWLKQDNQAWVCLESDKGAERSL